MYTLTIKTVAKRTGLSTHAIRAWEKRYGAIEPARSAGRHRMYSEADLVRLNLLAEACRTGRAISQLAKLPNEALSELLGRKELDRPALLSAPTSFKDDPGDRSFCSQALEAIVRLDTAAFDDTLQRALVALGDQGLLRRVIVPLARDVGSEWQAGRMTAAQEHFFTSLAKMFAWNLTRQYRLDSRAPQIVVGTPSGQLHDLGAMIVAAAAANRGWRVVFLGANLPAFELVGAVQTSGACALALSLVYPDDDPTLAIELERLGTLLPSHIRLIAGGRATVGYLPILQKIGARIVDGIEDLDLELDSVRRVSRRA